MKNHILIIIVSFWGVTANGQIISYSTGDSIQIDIPSTGLVLSYLDLNQDGINDFEIQKNESSGNYYCSINGLNDSSDMLHKYFLSGPMSGYHIVTQTDSTLSDASNWMANQAQNPSNASGSAMIHHTNSSYPVNYSNTNFYLGMRFNIEGADFLMHPHYACLDLTLTSSLNLIVHGWSYNTVANEPITCTDSLFDETWVGIEENVFENMVFPNPSKNGLVYSTEPIKSAEVFDFGGRKIQSDFDINNVYISHLPAGLYILKINGIAHKIILE